MSDTTAISITGIVVSGLVGPTVGAYWSDRRSARERRLALAEKDLHELRNLFADCLKLMIDARLALLNITRSTQKGILVSVDPASQDETMITKILKAQEEVTKLQKHVVVMQQDYPRLVLMLGSEHPAVETFLEATGELANTLSAPARLVGGEISPDETVETLVAGQKALSTYVARFIGACESVAKREPAQ
jgi:hypothetical protein